MVEEKKIRAKIFRFDPKKDKEPRYETFEVPFEEGMSVLNVLQHIYENIDPSLAFYYSCRIGRCGGCEMMVNGQAEVVCCTKAGEEMTIEPPLWLGLKSVKDLISNVYLINDRNYFSMPMTWVAHRFNKAYEEVKTEKT